MKSTRFGYVISQEKSNGSHYAHLYVVITPIGQRFVSDFSATLKWQADDEMRDGKRCNWYGVSIAANARHAEDLTILSRIVSRLEKALQDRKNAEGTDLAEFALRKMSPANVCWALETVLRIPRCVYDARVSETLPIKDLADLTFSRWGNAHVNVVAENEEHARKLALKEMANSRYVSTAEIQAWLNSGSPMKQDTYSPAPSFPSTLESALEVPFHAGVEFAPGY